MQENNSLKKEFLKKWIRGLQICTSFKENMSLLERKNAIKLSADLAMASTRNVKRHWSRALISKASKDSQTGILAKQILQGSNLKSKYNFSSKNDHFVLNATCTKHKTSMIRAHRGNNWLTATTTQYNFFRTGSISPTISRKISKVRKYGPRKSSGAPNSYYSKVMKARLMAKKLMNKRREILEGLVPGGEFMDEYSLVKETLDYIVSLQAQVEVMHHIANYPQLPV